MGQGDNCATGAPVFLARGDDALRDTLTAAGWRVQAAAGWTGAPPLAPIVLVDLRKSDVLPPDWSSLADAVARGRGALGAIGATGSASLLGEALRSGATHVAMEPGPAALSLMVASMGKHIERLATAAAPAAGEATSGWSGPRDALARVDAALAADDAASVLLVALERFDVVNAAYGRLVGDQVLEAVARRIARACGDPLAGAPLVVRVAGSEFLVVPAADRWHADVAERIAAGLSDPIVASGVSVTIGHRIALAIAAPGEGASGLVERLRDEMRVARVDLPAAPEDADALAVDLHHAIERGEVELLFQPQVALAGGQIVGVEALARWAHPRLGTLGAEPLLAAAGRAGLGGSLSAHIQALALRHAAAWTGRLATLRLSINVTAQDIAAPGFADHFLARLAASGFPAGRLTVEVTETGLILDLEAAAAALAAVRAAGCRVALDDFGTGYSSLAYLSALPVDYLKIDRAITRTITGSARDRAVLAGVVGIARALGLGTIVEGVETAGQRDRLAALGCDLYQGFLCAGPIAADALARLLEEE